MAENNMSATYGTINKNAETICAFVSDIRNAAANVTTAEQKINDLKKSFEDARNAAMEILVNAPNQDANVTFTYIDETHLYNYEGYKHILTSLDMLKTDYITATDTQSGIKAEAQKELDSKMNAYVAFIKNVIYGESQQTPQVNEDISGKTKDNIESQSHVANHINKELPYVTYDEVSQFNYLMDYVKVYGLKSQADEICRISSNCREANIRLQRMLNEAGIIPNQPQYEPFGNMTCSQLTALPQPVQTPICNNSMSPQISQSPFGAVISYPKGSFSQQCYHPPMMPTPNAPIENAPSVSDQTKVEKEEKTCVDGNEFHATFTSSPIGDDTEEMISMHDVTNIENGIGGSMNIHIGGNLTVNEYNQMGSHTHPKNRQRK